MRVLRFVVVIAAVLYATAFDAIAQDAPAAWYRRAGAPATLNAVTYGGGLFVAVGESGAILTSTDGGGWTLRESGVNTSLKTICFGNGLFVAGGSPVWVSPSQRNKIFSRDGIHWTVVPAQTPNPNFPDVVEIIYTDKRFVALGTYNSSGPAETQTSSDGTNWIIRSVTYGNPITSGNPGFGITASRDSG